MLKTLSTVVSDYDKKIKTGINVLFSTVKYFKSLLTMDTPLQFVATTSCHKVGVCPEHAKESLHPWVKVDQAGRPLQPKQLSILEGLTLNLDYTLCRSLRD